MRLFKFFQGFSLTRLGVVILLMVLQGTAVLPAKAAPEPEPVDAPLFAGAASISINGLGNVPIGQDVSFSVSFDNVGTTAGYGPFVDVILDTTGADGVYPGTPAANTYDGLGTSSITAEYLGITIPAQDFFVIEIDADGTVDHPFALRADGTKVTVTGTPGDTLVVVRLPFGSFSPDQPPAAIDFTVNMSNLADLNVPLSVSARGGFEFGALTPLNDWCCGDDAESTLTPWSNGTVTPTLFTLSKSFSGPEGETATGPNFPRSYTVTVNVASGQTINNLVLTDVLPDNVQYVSMVTPSAASCSSLPSTSTPGGTLTCNLGNVSGTANMTFNFYVPRLYDAPNPPDNDALFDDPILNASTGDDGSACNNASITGGTWSALDARDLTGMDFTSSPHDPSGCENTFTPKSIAIQKGVTIVGGGDSAPGKVLQYTLNVQISDFFAFNGVVATDVLSDGQHFDATFTPTIQVNGNGYTIATRNIDPANYTVDESEIDLSDGPPAPPAENPATDGTTTLTFRISDEIDRTQPNGRMIGGCVDPINGSSTPNCTTYNNSATTATIVFRTVIQESFSDTYPTGDWSVDQGDALDDTVSVFGNVLNTSLPFTPTGNSETDDSNASVSIGRGVLVKSIYAINGSTTLPTNASGQVIIKPGDTVTYRLVYDLETSDVENLYFEDYLPLPIFHVDDPNEDGAAGPTWTFDATVSAAAPASGVAKLGPTDTFYAYTAGVGTTGALSANTLHVAPATREPQIIIDSGNNKLTIAYATYDDTRNLAQTIDLLFTVTVSDEPFADNLYLTNQATANEGSTFNSPASTTSIIQLVLTEPVLVHKKGAVATDNPNATFSPAAVGPVTFNAPGTVGDRWAGTITSPGLASNPIDSNITGVDAGDLVSFAIVIENTGSSAKGAFDLTILDTLPAMYDIPAGGLNLRISNGDRSTVFSYTRPDGSLAVPTDLFSTGIEIVDPDPNNGACQAHTVGAGKNIIIITYDLQVRPDVTPGTQENTATLVNYAGSDNGPNHVPAVALVDTASSTVLGSLAKTLEGTEIITADNSATEVVIGELVTYRLTATVPEGSVPTASITDTLDAGLGLVSCTSVTASSTDVTTDLASGSDFSGACNDMVVTDAQNFTFDLGNVTNVNRDNATPETITVEYVAVVLNVSGNQSGTLLNNEARFFTDVTQLGTTQNAPQVTVIEPNVAVTKTVSPTGGDAGDAFTYTITISGATGTDAYEVTLDDTIPALMVVDPTFTVNDSAGLVTTANFDLTGNVVSTNTPFDMPVSATRQIVLTFTGTVSYSANPGQAIVNDAIVKWTSMDGDITNRSTHASNDDERTGSGAPVVNDNSNTGSATFSVNLTSAVKSIVSTSEAHTAETGDGSTTALARPVTIGEIVRFRLVEPIPEGSSPNFQVRDLLPTGFTFIEPDGVVDTSVQVGFVFDNSITSAGIDIVAAVNPAGCVIADTGAALTCSLPDGNIGSGSSTASDPDVFGTGVDPYFKLGDLVNNDNDGTPEYAVIEFNALIDNSQTAGVYNNQAGDTPYNIVAVYINGSQNSLDSERVYVRIVEPLITPVKSATPASGDAGDVITYVLVFSNTGTNASTAYEVSLTDTVPGKMTANLGSMTLVDDDGSGGSCATPATNTSAGNNINITYTSVPVGCTVTATYTATLNATVTAGEALANTVVLDYSSLPGTGTSPNPTGSTTPGASGAVNGERSYNEPAHADVTVTNFNAVKSILSASEAHTTGSGSGDGTPGNAPDLAIGEMLVYRLVTDIPEGTQTDFQEIDILPAGFTYVGSPIMTFIADSDMTEDAALSGADTNPDTFPPTFAVPAYSGVGSVGVEVSGQTVTFHLGDVVNNDSDSGGANGAEQVIIDFTVQVNNDANANNTDLKNNNYTVWTENNSGVLTQRQTSNTVQARIVEPLLNVAKSANDSSWIYGQDVTFTLNITHVSPTSLTEAFEIVVTDTIPASLTYVPGSITSSGNWVGNDSSAPTLTWTCAQTNPTACSLPLTGGNSTATLTYHATVDSPPDPTAMATTDTAINNVVMTWTSLPGVTAGERTGTNPIVQPNDYTDTASHTGSLDYYALGNRVWFDTDNDSLIDFPAPDSESEQPAGTKIGVDGVTLKLYRDNGSGTYIDTGLTDVTANGGYYLFDNLQSGNYIVVIPDTEFVLGKPLYGYWSSATTLNNAGVLTETTAALANNDVDSDDNGTLQSGVATFPNAVVSSVIVLGPSGGTEPTGEHNADVDPLETGTEHQGLNPDARANMTVDFGFYRVGVGDIVWMDNVTVDGNYGGGESLIDGATANLFAGNGTTQLAVASDGVWQKTTGVFSVSTGDAANGWANGYYEFTGLPEGNYIIKVVGPTGAISTIDSADTNTPNNNVNNNDNGVGNTSNSVASNQVTLDAGVVGSAPNTVTYTTGTSFNPSMDFGFTNSYALGNRVWFDTDNDSLVDFPSESVDGSSNKIGVDGVTVELYPADGTGAPISGSLLQTTTTANGGYYLFDGLAPGDYVVVIPASNFTGVGRLASYWSSATQREDDGTLSEVTAADAELNIDSDDNGTRQNSVDFANAVISSMIRLGPTLADEPTDEHNSDVDANAPGTEHQGTVTDDRANMTVDFGFYRIEVSDLVFVDANKNGIYDAGDAPIAGVDLELFSANGVSLGTTTTDVNGNYIFGGQPTGNYYIRVTSPDDSLSTVDNGHATDNATPDDNIDNNDNGVGVSGGDVVSSVFRLYPGVTQNVNAINYSNGTTTNPTLDFGFTYLFSLGNRVWYDYDNNSIINSENGIPGVLVELYSTSDLTTALTTDTTDADGYYHFDNLQPGEYVVVIPASNFSSGSALNGYLSSGTLVNGGVYTETPAPDADTNPTDSGDNGTKQDAGTFINAVTSLPITLGPLADEPTGEADLEAGIGQGKPDAQANMTVDFGFYPLDANFAKVLVNTDIGNDASSNVAIGELLTYQIVMNVSPGAKANSILVDVMQPGLVFAGLESITISDLDTDAAGLGDTGIYSSVMTFDSVTGVCTNCAAGTTVGMSNPLVENSGNKTTFDFGVLTNSAASDLTVTVRYTAVPLDSITNKNGVSLTNSVNWTWSGGNLPATSPMVTVNEPALSIVKTADPTVAALGATIGFTIDVAHTAASSATAYDVVVTDTLPTGLEFNLGSATFTGLAPTSFSYDPVTTTLRFVWDEFPLGQTVRINFTASFIGPAPVTNAANVEWTSHPIDPLLGAPVQRSPFNAASTERWYDPLDATGLNTYGSRSTVTITSPSGGLPETGFAPGVVTLLPAQPSEKMYSELSGAWLEIPNLGVIMPLAGVPIVDQKWDLTWLSDQAGYLEGTTYPGQKGTTGVTGHVTLADGTAGPFRNLNRLLWGNQIILHVDGYRYIYEVREMRTVLPSDMSVFSQDKYTWLTLVTCKDYVARLDTYNYRYAVRAVLMKVEVDSSRMPVNAR